MNAESGEDAQRSISVRARRNIIDTLRVEKTPWWGRLSEIDFLSRLWDLEKLPSHDYRFQNAARDIWQHRGNNDDWPDDWIFGDPRFNLLRGPDDAFLRFLCEMIHPIVRTNEDEVETLIGMFNDHLRSEGWEIVEVTRLSGRPVFAGRKLLEFPTRAAAEAATGLLDTPYVSQQIIRMEAAITDDPELAIGTAKEFVETVAKTILKERGVAIGAPT